MNTWLVFALGIGFSVLLAAFLLTVIVCSCAFPDMEGEDVDEFSRRFPLLFVWCVSCMAVGKAIGFVLDIVFKPFDLAWDGIRWLFGKRGE